MNDQDLEAFEADLQRLRPAEPPPVLMARLNAAVEMPARPPCEIRARQSSFRDVLAPWFRWFAPAMTAAAVALTVWLWPRSPTAPDGGLPPTPITSAVRPDDVQLDRRLVGAFDALAQLPGGETVRFRCQEWTDQMTLRDAARGIEVVQRTPSFEILPVRFETY